MCLRLNYLCDKSHCSDSENLKSCYYIVAYQFQDEEGDYLAKLAKLVNAIGLQLIASWQK